MSFRTRLLAAGLATFAVGLGGLLVVGNVVLAGRVRAEQSNLLRGRAAAVISSLDVKPGRVAVRETANDGSNDRLSWIVEGRRVLERPPGVGEVLDRQAVALGGLGRRAERDDAEGNIRLRAEPIRAAGSGRSLGAVVVGASVEPFERIQRGVLVGSVIAALLILLAGWLAIRGAIGGALRPVARMTDAAADWGAHDLDRRFALGPARDELGALANTLDGLLGRIAASRRHEQRFASEVAHELRTPLTALRARAELASGDATGESREALRAVVAQAERLDAVIETLLAVARGEAGTQEGEVDLLAIAREFEGTEVLAREAVPLAEGSPEIARRALAPLVDNAHRHARSRVSLEVSAHGGSVQVAVRDDGEGLDPSLGEGAFEPGVRGPRETGSGAGLGLALARRLARSCGGDVVVGEGPGGSLVLELPELDAGGEH